MGIKLENIDFYYPDGTGALFSVSLSIRKGEKIALLGENGSGKSTLLMLLAGICKPQKGRYLIDEQDAFTTKDLFKKAGLVFQDPDVQLFAPTVYQEVSFGPMNLGLTKTEVENITVKTLNDLGIFSLKDTPPHHLSYGQKKRVGIADILAMKPEILLLDEPMSWLDSRNRKMMADLLRHIELSGKTVVLSSHDTSFAYSWADRVIVLSNGRIVLDGSPAEVFKDEKMIQDLNLEMPFFIRAAKALNFLSMPSNGEAFLRMAGERE